MTTLAQPPKYAVRHYEREPEPLKWQQRALENIDVYEINGPSSCVYLDRDGKLLDDHQDFAARIPIEDFAPDPESEQRLGKQLINFARGKKAAKECPLDKAKQITDYGPVLKAMDVESIRDHIRKSRRQYGEEYAFVREDRDKMQINAFFVEINKYPEIAYELFKSGFYTAIVGNKGLNIHHLSHDNEDGTAGYFHSSTYMIAATMQPDYSIEGTMAERTSFDQLVAEEMLHALDHHAEERTGAISDSFSPSFRNVLEGHTKKLENLYERMKREYETESPQTYSQDESNFKDNLLKLAQSNMAAKLKLGYTWKRNSNETALLILEKSIEQLKDAHEFPKYKIYENLSDEGTRQEIFAKTAKYILLNRYEHQYGDAGAYKAVEDFLYSPREQDGRVIDPNPLTDLRKALDEKKAKYIHSTTHEERDQAKAFADHIARNVEQWSRGSTGYILDMSRKNSY